jgi:hypothetical protein
MLQARTRLVLDAQQAIETMSLQELASQDIQSPELQRDVDEERVQSILQYQHGRIAKGHGLLFIGSLVVARGNDNGLSWLLDGQHRHQAMLKLALQEPDYMIQMTVLYLSPTLTLSDAFRLINASVPVPQYVIDSTLHASRRTSLDRFAELFGVEHKAFISKAAMPRRPNINISQFQDRINEEQHIIDAFLDGDHLMEYVRWVNAMHLKNNSESDLIKRSIDKAKSFNSKNGGNVVPLALCSDPDYTFLRDAKWLNAFVQGELPPSLPSSSCAQRRQAVPSALRAALWNRDCGEREGVGKCACCLREILQQGFHAGHVRSVAEGGATVLDNLVVLCANCNLSMGSQDYHSFSAAFRA